ncbi:SIR2 family protein [Enterococcus dongliensis]|uniref:SIR2 family protein n=1 Tax=Enterococcus dongliensis TaxID=2559925 RepID=A0ABU3ERI7_9ENTE|nr:SIR2 family protein [Enterococcus dongliensis]MDT2597474.1 SIR2 family protein [Enterococcus dongliensis]
MNKQLEQLLVDNPEVYKALNIIALEKQEFKTMSYYTRMINKYMDSSVNGMEVFKQFVEAEIFERKIMYECEEENYRAEVLEKNCENCKQKVLEHEYEDMFMPIYHVDLSKHNENLLSDYFDADSQIVMNDLQKNIGKTIPFVGSGISKTAGLPLWLEMFKIARNSIPKDFLPYFDMEFESKDVDRIIESIKKVHPLISDDKDLKKEIIIPQVKSKVTNDALLNSVMPEILSLGSEYIITTNYDNLLEKTSRILELDYEESRSIDSFQGFESLEDSNYIFHIHGVIDKFDSMVVTNKDYENLYDSEEKKRILAGLINQHSMLFLGFSMNDAYFSNEFGKICDSNRGYCTNYYVMINGDRQKKDELLKTSNVRFINIKAEDFEIKKQYKFMCDYISGNIFIK